MMCARCRIQLIDSDCQGESGIYSPNRTFTLCEPCFEDEDKEIEHGNDLPHRLEEYRANLRAGPLNHRSVLRPKNTAQPRPSVAVNDGHPSQSDTGDQS
jgi:hypothetical protein